MAEGGAEFLLARMSLLERGYELRKEGTPLATIRPTGIWSPQHRVRTPGSEWRLCFKGLSSRKAELWNDMDPRPSNPAARLGHGAVELGSGETYPIRRKGTFLPTWILLDPLGSPLVTAKTVAGLGDRVAEIDAPQPLSAPLHKALLVVCSMMIHRIEHRSWFAISFWDSAW